MPQVLQETDDDAVVPFSVPILDVRGRVVQLGESVTNIINAHGYNPLVSDLLAQAITLTGLLGTNLKFDGNLILQTQTDGPVNLVICDFRTPGQLRACLKYDEEKLKNLEPNPDNPIGQLLGKGHLAMTLEQGEDAQRYQGIVALDHCGFEDAINQYFVQSEQIPTFIRLTSAEMMKAGGEKAWRGGGYMVQFLPDKAAKEDDDQTNENWQTSLALSQTLKDDELIDPFLSPERLIYRLFHEFEPVAFEPHRLKAKCHCSMERIEAMLGQFSKDDLEDMADDGQVEITCEFCNKSYQITI